MDNAALSLLASTMEVKGPPTALIWIQIILLFFGGVLAASSFIVSKKPHLKHVIDNLVPFQAIIGVGLLVVAIILLVKIGPVDTFKAAQLGMGGLALFGIVAAGFVLGFLFGVPQIVKWMPGQGQTQQKAMELVQMLSAFQIMIGGVGLAAAAVAMLYQLKILT